MSKRVTEIFKRTIPQPTPYLQYFMVEGDGDSYSRTGYLGTEYKMHIPQWEAMGKPDKIRLTVSVVNDS